jgi:hypothetical protein
VDPFFAWLESTAFSTWMRETPSIFAFPMILTLHTIGMAAVVGVNVAIALRIIGVGASYPVIEMRRFLPLMWSGFWLNAASGVALLLGYPTKALTNPVFYFKLLLIGLALGLGRSLGRQIFSAEASETRASGRIRMLAVASLACWMAAVTAGRLLAYTHTRLLVGF